MKRLLAILIGSVFAGLAAERLFAFGNATLEAAFGADPGQRDTPVVLIGASAVAAAIAFAATLLVRSGGVQAGYVIVGRRQPYIDVEGTLTRAGGVAALVGIAGLLGLRPDAAWTLGITGTILSLAALASLAPTGAEITGPEFGDADASWARRPALAVQAWFAAMIAVTVSLGFAQGVDVIIFLALATTAAVTQVTRPLLVRLLAKPTRARSRPQARSR